MRKIIPIKEVLNKLLYNLNLAHDLVGQPAWNIPHVNK